jgi:hypothetical protein
LRFSIQTSAGGTQNIESDRNIIDNNWHHILGTYDGSVMKLYVDGVLSKTEDKWFPGDIAYGNYDLYIGDSFNGQIDDVRIYNYALTPTQVKTLYNNGAVAF